MPALVDAILAQEGQRQALERRLASLDTPVVAFDTQLERKLERVGEWRAVLSRQPALARQVLGKLHAGKIAFQPEKGGFRFQATGTVEKLLAGAVPTAFTSRDTPNGIRTRVTAVKE